MRVDRRRQRAGRGLQRVDLPLAPDPGRRPQDDRKHLGRLGRGGARVPRHPGKPSNWTCFFRLVHSAGAHEVPYSSGLPPALREVDSLIQVLDRHAREP